MMFDEILETLKVNGKSGAAYEKASAVANAAMQAEPERAAGYQLLVALANRFLDSTGRLPVSSTQIENAFANFEAQAVSLAAAYDSQDTAQIAATLNQVALITLQPFDSAPG